MNPRQARRRRCRSGRRSSSARPGTPGRARSVARRDPCRRRRPGQVRRDQARPRRRPPGRRRIGRRRTAPPGSSTSSPAPARRAPATAATVASTSRVRVPPSSAISAARWMVGPSMTGSLYGQAHLDHVNAGIDHGVHRRDPPVDGREAGRKVADQRRRGLPSGRVAAPRPRDRRAAPQALAISRPK